MAVLIGEIDPVLMHKVQRIPLIIALLCPFLHRLSAGYIVPEIVQGQALALVNVQIVPVKEGGAVRAAPVIHSVRCGFVCPAVSSFSLECSGTEIEGGDLDFAVHRIIVQHE
ncbi:hypothetical protein D3C73_1321730 [compost metagenome]